ncbi:MAG: hypothetical protein KJ558_12005 [Gammaproteobacteria bacterium]|nr:hypothetical protein [Gammaproteobacteria bacterium]MBU1655528.1 hypothetical protein [Gammaproteobacteria bacterium]MBU1961276.1 hypothetical protein [Gammaproteobacteria bacterium]
MKHLPSLFLLGLALIFPQAASALQCDARAQVDKCASQCRYCTEGNHGPACFAGWWNAWLKPSYQEPKWMLANGSFSQGHKTALLSSVLEGVAAKKGVKVENLNNDDVAVYGNEVVGSALGTLVHGMDMLGIKDNNLKIQCYQWCDQIDPITYRNNTDVNKARAGTQLDDGACATDGAGAWNPKWPKDAIKAYRNQ